MRNLSRNQDVLWIINKTGETDEIDEDGNYTGAIINSYGSPIKIQMTIYPATSSITETIFGKAENLDMIGSTVDLILDKNTLVFKSEPLHDYANSYDYSISMISKSLNVTQYGLKRRI